MHLAFRHGVMLGPCLRYVIPVRLSLVFTDVAIRV